MYDDCGVCMQKKNGLAAEFFSSRAAKESSRKLWNMIVTNLVYILGDYLRSSTEQ